MTDALAELRLQMEWGADEALADEPSDRFARPTPPTLKQRPAAAPEPEARSRARTLEELHAALDAFEGCSLRTTATNTVRPDGNPRSRLLVIGDAPGSDDDRSGRAFSGPAGELLDRVFGSIGQSRQSMLLTPLVPWRPPGNRPLAPAEIQVCLPFLHNLIGLVQPRHMVLLGTGPVRALTGNLDPIRRLRGEWMRVQIDDIPEAIPTMALPPIEQWLRSPTSKQELWADLVLLRITVTSS